MAKGSSPTKARAHQMAWPRPIGTCWRTVTREPGSIAMARSSASVVVLAALLKRALQLVGDVEMLDDGGLAAAGDEAELLDAGFARFLDRVLDERLSTTGSISFASALVAGRKRVPRPATGRTAFLSGLRTDTKASWLG